MDTVDTGSPRAIGRGLPVATVSISHIWHERSHATVAVTSFRTLRKAEP